MLNSTLQECCLLSVKVQLPDSAKPAPFLGTVQAGFQFFFNLTLPTCPVSDSEHQPVIGICVTSQSLQECLLRIGCMRKGLPIFPARMRCPIKTGNRILDFLYLAFSQFAKAHGFAGFFGLIRQFPKKVVHCFGVGTDILSDHLPQRLAFFLVELSTDVFPTRVGSLIKMDQLLPNRVYFALGQVLESQPTAGLLGLILQLPNQLLHLPAVGGHVIVNHIPQRLARFLIGQNVQGLAPQGYIKSHSNSLLYICSMNLL